MFSVMCVCLSFCRFSGGEWGLPIQWRIYIVKFWTCAPLGVQILSISCSFWEILAKSYVGAPPRGVGAPPQKILDPPLPFDHTWTCSLSLPGPDSPPLPHADPSGCNPPEKRADGLRLAYYEPLNSNCILGYACVMHFLVFSC